MNGPAPSTRQAAIDRFEEWLLVEENLKPSTVTSALRSALAWDR
jgi:hypothetical protein